MNAMATSTPCVALGGIAPSPRPHCHGEDGDADVPQHRPRRSCCWTRHLPSASALAAASVLIVQVPTVGLAW
jgi:hypothetical protein